MTRILFVCHGNICRSPMAEFIFRDLVKKEGAEGEYSVESAAVSAEELGNPVYPPARRKLAEHGLDCAGKRARQIAPSDYARFDLIIGMDRSNLTRMERIFGGDRAHKLKLLSDYAGSPGEIADPWYTGDFEAAWRDIEAGCKGLLKTLGSAKR